LLLCLVSPSLAAAAAARGWLAGWLSRRRAGCGGWLLQGAPADALTSQPLRSVLKCGEVFFVA